MREKCIGYRALSCRPIEEGSLGIKNLKVFNESLLGKWVCKIRNERSSLWYRALSCRYMVGMKDICARERGHVNVVRAICNLDLGGQENRTRV